MIIGRNILLLFVLFLLSGKGWYLMNKNKLEVKDGLIY